MALDDWETVHPAPAYYLFPPRLNPDLFIGLNRFVAGRIHQMRAGKSYFAAHPSCWSYLPDDTSPSCGSAPETFEYSILHCPEKSRERLLLLGQVTSVEKDSPLWSQSSLLHALSRFITATHTGFPPEMHPLSPPPSPNPLTPLSND